MVARMDELLEINLADRRHLFYEQMQRLFYAMQWDKPEDLDDEPLERFMKAAVKMSNVLYLIEIKRRSHEKKTQTFAPWDWIKHQDLIDISSTISVKLYERTYTGLGSVGRRGSVGSMGSAATGIW